ncbi:MAG: hypothetical protein ACLUAR_16925 [Pilosibacter sp.]
MKHHPRRRSRYQDRNRKYRDEKGEHHDTAAGSENADTDHGPEEAVETETAAAADRVAGSAGRAGNRGVRGSPQGTGDGRRDRRGRGTCREAFTEYSEAITMFFSGSFRRKPKLDIEGRVMVAEERDLKPCGGRSFPNATITKVVAKRSFPC